MRDPKRIPAIIGLLREVWQASPDMRLGQLISDAHSLLTEFNSSDLFHLEDEYLAEGLKKIATSQSVASIVSLCADVERIGRERATMTAANVELQLPKPKMPEGDDLTCNSA